VLISSAVLFWNLEKQMVDESVNFPASNKAALQDSKGKSAPAGITDTKEEVNQESDYILDCSGDFPNNISESDLKKYSDPDYFDDAFKGNKELSSQIAYALSTNSVIGKIDEGQIDQVDPVVLLGQLVNEQPYKSLVHYFLVSKCNEQSDSPRCDDSVISEAISNDPNNGALWFQIAAKEARKNNLEGLILALEQLISAPNYNEYWAETIEIFDRALQSNGLVKDGPRMIMAIGYAAAVSLGPIQELFKACREHSTNRADIAQLCIDAGQKVSTHAKTILNQALGYSLQEQVFKAINDSENEVKMRKLKISIYRVPKASIRINKLLIFDEELGRYWFTQLKLFGERKFFQLAYDEAVRLSSNPDYNPCN